MKTPDSQATYPAWMAQLADPAAWQAWLKQPRTEMSTMATGLPDFDGMIDGAAMTQLQNDYMKQFSALWQDLLISKAPAIKDKRFSTPAWQSNPLCAFNAGVYLLNAQFLMAMADAVQVPHKAKQKIRFTVQQMIDAMSPANFLASNPEAQQKIVETNGASLVKGIEHMLSDMQKGHISQTDDAAFEVGKNVATSEGAVVFENELFQLIQYKPLTETVYETPLLMVPPCINKYYILDLQPNNSLVRYAVEQGHTVFMVSWRNADLSLANATWDNYIEDATIKAIHVVQEISTRDKINALGFCVGGTMLCTALAVLAARGEKPLASLTLLTSFLDFTDTGVIDVFIDDVQVQLREQAIGHGGLMPGRDFAAAFSSLRPNDLIWNYVDSNYLKGKDPLPFDLLYWNADSTNLPGPMFCWYLRHTYLENSLKVPGKLTVAGQKVDLGKINAPAFIYASREDHIVPWTSAYASTALLNPKKPGLNRFILGASGHIAGVINHPAKNKRSYWTNDKTTSDTQAWLADAKEHPGSWWPEWTDFLARHAGKQVPAPSKYGNAKAKYKAIEAAPGRYVKAKAV
jgi:polyhydroxyalkanoate synthase